MSATEELRKLLDERGVEYETADGWWTSWDTAGALDVGAVVYCEDLGSGLEIRWHTITPEQAIAATLGVLHDNPYVGLVRGKQWERHEMSDYYCGRCGWKVTDHNSYCPECGGALHKTPNKPDSQFDARKTAETTENATAKCEIRDFVDTREKLEAEIFKCDEDAQKYSFGAVFLDTRKILGWLDRQAAITEREWREKCASDECCDFQELVDANAELQGKVDGLEAERTCRNDKDKWSGLAKYLFVCSECGWNLVDVGNDAIDISARLMKRCPMCGARVIGTEAVE